MTEKKPNINILFGIIGFIFIILGGFIFVNEYTLITGDELLLETMPVDPRDPLRGDFVVLRYAFEGDEKLKNYILDNNIEDNTTLYVSFTQDENKLGTLSNISQEKPNDGIFLQVSTQERNWWRTNIETGISKYFVPEGTGRQIERVRGETEVLVKVDKYGKAKIVELYYKGEKIDPKTFDPDM